MASLLKMGSSGSQVRRLQELLDQKGYALEADGIFGEKTRAAVLNYQRENQLAVDGIVGDATWASLETQIPPQAEVPEAEIPFEEKNTAQRLEMYENEVPEFRESEALSQAVQALKAMGEKKPSPYQGSYDEQIDQVLQEVLGAKEFSYDPTQDPAWQTYREQYIQGGRMASMDTLGQAAGLTGGYGNSYAQTAASQAYQRYMTALSAKLPEMYEAAYGRHRSEREALYDRAAMLLDMDEQAYRRYRDETGDWQDAYDDAYRSYRDLYDEEWDRYTQARSEWYKERDYYADKAQEEAALASKASSSRAGSGGSSAKKRTLTFSNYLSRATTQYNASGAEGLYQYLTVNRDAQGANGLTDEEIDLICRQFGFSTLSALRSARDKQDKKASSAGSASKNSSKISVR